MTDPRDLLVEVALGALAAVEPARLVREALDGWAPTHADVLVLGCGKAAPAMAVGAVDMLGDGMRGAVVGGAGAESVPGLEVIVAGHPTPTEGSVRGGRRLLDLAATATPGTSVIVLLSGGASALCAVPLPGIRLDDLIDLTRRLLRSGAPIEEVNEVRAGLSTFKAGGLGGALGGAGEVRVLAISDVVGSDPAVIGSGPTVPRRVDPVSALAVADRWGVEVPARVRRALGSVDRVDRRWYPVEVIADGQTLAVAAVEAARARGVEAGLGWTVTGEARRTAAAVVAGAVPGLTAHAGETVVTDAGDLPGGRNQEAALAAARALPMASASAFLAIGSDGIDGTTEDAGAVVDDTTWQAILDAGIDPAERLDAHDAHGALESVGALVRTGPTGTNVADLWLVWRPS